MFGAIELGGTKIICGVGRGPRDIVETSRIETAAPKDNLQEIVEFFKQMENQLGNLQSIGIASFGPIVIEQSATDYGTFLKTPKAGWSHFDLRDQLLSEFAIDIDVTTDVNGALLAEHQFGAAQGFNNAVYVTIGTGVGAGILVNGELVSGFMHPEVGHMRIPSNGVTGICPFHGNCLEGMVSGPAIAARAGIPADQLADTDPLWHEVAKNIAHMCTNFLTILATEKIILGGGVMNKAGLLELVREAVKESLAGYLPLNERANGIDQIIVKPALGNDSGLTGAFLMASGIE